VREQVEEREGDAGDKDERTGSSAENRKADPKRTNLSLTSEKEREQ